MEGVSSPRSDQENRWRPVKDWHAMGSGASSPQPDKDSEPQEKRPIGTAKPLEIDDTKKHLVRTNEMQVAPVIIKNCKEEWQHVSEIKEPIVYGQISDNMPEHALIKGMYFMVRDTSPEMDKLGTYESKLAPNLRKCKGGYPVYGLGQPTRDGLMELVQGLSREKHPYIFLINLRQEPVLFARVGYDLVPYSPRHQDALGECVQPTATNAFTTEEYETDIRKEIIELAHFKDDQRFYFYHDLDAFSEDPHMYRIAYEDDLMVTEEVYSRLSFNNSHIKYLRMPLPQQGPALEETIDRFLTLFRNIPDWHKPGSKAPCCVVTSHQGEGRATYGMVLSCLVIAHRTGFPSEASRSPPTMNPKSPSYERGEFYVIQELVRLLPDGPRVKHQVDVIIDECGAVHNLRTAASEAKASLASITDDYVIEGVSAKEHFLKKCYRSLERYFSLICFNAYLHSQGGVILSRSFTEWMRENPELYHLLANLDTVERAAAPDLLLNEARFLVADEFVGLDVLSSQFEVKTSNFRRMSGLPVYGMSQPSREGLSAVVNHLLHKKQGHPRVVWVNLRQDLVIEGNSATYSLREGACLDEPIIIPGISDTDIQAKEEQLKEVIKSKKTLKVYTEVDEAPSDREFQSVLTCCDLADQQIMQTDQLEYHRIPVPDDVPPPENFFDDVLTVIKSLKAFDDDEDGPALVFQCRTGKGRTTTAMAIAGLVVCHKKGFPYGTKPGEEERVSLPNAKYTQGHYKIVQDVVRRIPNGQQVKREVDFVLNSCSDTMTPMHYHMREVIFVTYNKMKKAKTPEEQQFYRRRSLDYLERYIYLILFNTYLHCERRNKWRVKFAAWMKEVAAEAGIYEILDNLRFADFEEKEDPMRRKYVRSTFSQARKLPIRGTVI